MSEQPIVVAHDEKSVIVVNDEQPIIVSEPTEAASVSQQEGVLQQGVSDQSQLAAENISSAKAKVVSAPSARQSRRESVEALSPYQQTEVLIQYGHLEEDLQQLAMATHRQKERAQEFGLAMMFAMAAPFVAIESLYGALRAVAPSLMIEISKALSSLMHSDEFYFEQFHGLLYAIGGPILILILILFALYRVHALGPWGPFAPTHIGLLPTGVRRHWKSLFLAWTPGIRPWKDVKSIEIREYGRKKQRKRITLRYDHRRPLSIEVTAIRRTPEKEALANALRYFLPTHVQGELNQLLEKTLPKQNRYTEIWTQALLNRPQRLLLTALVPQTVLHEGLYTIKEQIGAGGQGTAYLALTDGLIPEVVLKEYVLPDHNNVHDRRRALKRLEDEVQILSRLSHSQIVRLHDVFIEDHRAYLVLDFIDGPSLKTIVGKNGKFDVATTVDLSLQMCEMLKYLHSLSPPLVHQDFTPDNLLLTKSGVLKLVDFNVAKESATTKTSLVVGKQCYMPPEQFRGKTSVQSDIYAMGASLYFLLIGKEPEPLTASHPRLVCPDLPEELDRIIAKATALDPESRYECAADLEKDLRNAFTSSCDHQVLAITMEST
ncbi:hypothetical protein BH10CYA1_BH10CYA1_07350 [soil metagenome]